jgi:HEAT repeat protein
VSTSDVREAWLGFQSEVSTRALETKQSDDVVPALVARYGSLTDDDRDVVDELLAEQLSSTDETARFDALAVIAHFKVKSALPALRRLANDLESQTRPGAPYEWAKVNGIIAAVKDQ